MEDYEANKRTQNATTHLEPLNHGPSDSTTQIRWGILGCSNISSDFCIALQLCDGHKAVAVASRSRERAEKFADKFDIPTCYDSYEGLLLNGGVDIVYVGTFTSDHYRLCLQVLTAEKALLCEKPLCMSSEQCKDIIQMSRRHRKLMVEGLWSNSLPSYDRLRRSLGLREIGEVREVTVHFGLKCAAHEQLRKKHLGGGCIFGMACYPLHLVHMVFQGSLTKVEARAELDGTGLDERNEIVLEWDGGYKAQIKISLLDNYSNEAVIRGSGGSIRMKDFWCCEEMEVNGQTFKYPIAEPVQKTRYIKTAGFAHEIERVGEAWKRGLCELEEVRHEASMWVYEVIDQVLQQISMR